MLESTNPIHSLGEVDVVVKVRDYVPPSVPAAHGHGDAPQLRKGPDALLQRAAQQCHVGVPVRADEAARTEKPGDEKDVHLASVVQREIRFVDRG